MPAEYAARHSARRSICAIRNLGAGHVLTAEDLTCRRPGDGIDPRKWDAAIGSRLLSPVKANSPIVSDEVDWTGA